MNNLEKNHWAVDAVIIIIISPFVLGKLIFYGIRRAVTGKKFPDIDTTKDLPRDPTE